jgi:hypothetical protein
VGPTWGTSGGPVWESPGRKLRRVNESVDGYEPGGRTFESCWAHQVNFVDLVTPTKLQDMPSLAALGPSMFESCWAHQYLQVRSERSGGSLFRADG